MSLPLVDRLAQKPPHITANCRISQPPTRPGGVAWDLDACAFTLVSHGVIACTLSGYRTPCPRLPTSWPVIAQTTGTGRCSRLSGCSSASPPDTGRRLAVGIHTGMTLPANTRGDEMCDGPEHRAGQSTGSRADVRRRGSGKHATHEPRMAIWRICANLGPADCQTALRATELSDGK